MMLRRFAPVLAVVALATAALTVPAGATTPTPAPAGHFTCALSGRLYFTPGWNYTPQTVVFRTAARGASCNSAGVTGGIAPITDVMLRAYFTTKPGATCSYFLVDGTKRMMMQIKYRGRNAKNHTMTVASVRTPLHHMLANNASWTWDYEPATSGAFAGEPIHIDMTLTNLTAAISACGTATGVIVAPFTGTLTVG